MKNFQYLSLLLILVLVTVSAQVMAGGTPPPPPPDPPCWPPPCNAIPIDGGIGFLAAAAVAFGVKKLFGSRKNKG